ncbi:MAG: hypothetical protein OEW19_20985, partial [Acidobacteriota bacterium]|nr:hypothetical protein [Acidobacteriota bacterium]
MKSTRRFLFAGWSGEVSDGLIAADRLEATIRRLADPGQAKETLHWGGNYLYTMKLPEARMNGAGREVVVKQFPGNGWRARWQRRLLGSRARRSWRAALAVAGAGVPTPEPLFLIESERADGPSLYVTRKLDDFFESRYYFRAIAEG